MATVLVGHVTKDGSIAGPRMLEHLVDVVLHFDGDRHARLRHGPGVKNRFGPTDEVGCFELRDDGIVGLPDPSGLFLSQPRRRRSPGTCVTVTLEGRRPLLTEVQALVGERRRPSRRAGRRRGLDSARVAMLLAVLRAPAAADDRQAGHLRRDRRRGPARPSRRPTWPSRSRWPARARDLALPPGLVAIGEVGLAGEMRRVTGVQRRLAEAARLGFRTRSSRPGSPRLPPGEPGMRITEAADMARAISRGARRAADVAGPSRARPGAGRRRRRRHRSRPPRHSR